LAGGVPHSVPLLAESGFKPDLWGIDEAVARRAKVLFLNYPNNPTAATVERGFFKEVVDFASEHEILVLHDNPYSELTFDGYEAPSFLAAAGGGAKEVGVEFGSLSKTYNMTGWRIGFAVGNSEILRGLRLVKTNVDSGAFQAVQVAGITALTGSQECVKENVRVYRERREILVEGLRSAGLWEGKEVKKPRATFYLWVPVPSGYSSIQFSMFLLEQAGVVVTPGVGFGENGEGFVRFSLCTSAERLREACERLRGLKL
ncbi:MAG TPA: aminotransferase class I/II-fold pyridoxal phosphate-dependent enzyme, partial [Methanomicrobia archaeon]|nr:aminotransferase class I/II-fold pyridoxal phosphate-dependent enzyme [Methanomicrobia archaeon]